MDLDLALEPASILSAELGGIAHGLVALLPNLFAAAVVLMLTGLLAWTLGKGITRTFRRSRARPALIEAMRQLVRTLVWLLGLLVAATVMFPELSPTDALAGLGIGSIAVGLAFRDVFENFLAGFLILLRKPMRVGDDITCEHVAGRVEQIRMRDTWLRKRSGELVLVPNSFLFKNPLEVLTDLALRRIEVVAGVAYGEDVDRSRAVIEAAVASCDSVSEDRRIDVFASAFADSSMEFTVRWWTGSAPIDEHRSRDEVVAAIKRALDSAGIEIPFPYRTLMFKGSVPLRRADEGARPLTDRY